MDNPQFNPLMPQSNDRVLCFQIDRPISAAGYEQNFLPRVREVIARHGGLRLLIYYKNYCGWEEAAAQMDFEASFQFRDKVVKLALVNPPGKEALQKKIKQHYMSGELRFFSMENLDMALDWIKE